MDKTEIYDIIELPSKGQCYDISSPFREGKVKVSKLTVKDEDYLLSYRYIKENRVFDTLLKNKIITNGDVTELCSGDKEAIILWFMKDGYGSLQTFNENKTFNLDEIKYKDFKLKSDDNGIFTYILSNDKIVKYRYLSYKEEDKMLFDIINKFNNVNEEETYFDFFYSTTIPLLCSMIVSINDIRDKEDIEDFLKTMDFEEYKDLQKYISENKPGLDIETTNGLVFNDSIFYEINVKNNF